MKRRRLGGARGGEGGWTCLCLSVISVAHNLPHDSSPHPPLTHSLLCVSRSSYSVYTSIGLAVLLCLSLAITPRFTGALGYMCFGVASLEYYRHGSLLLVSFFLLFPPFIYLFIFTFSEALFIIRNSFYFSLNIALLLHYLRIFRSLSLSLVRQPCPPPPFPTLSPTQLDGRTAVVLEKVMYGVIILSLLSLWHASTSQQIPYSWTSYTMNKGWGEGCIKC